MSIFESLQTLPLDAKWLLFFMALVWGLSEIRHASRHRTDTRTIQRLSAVSAGAGSSEGAILEAHRLPEVSHGAALTLGELVPRGAAAGQHFVGAIRNAGPLPAADIQVTASLGAIKADVVAAPHRLPPHSDAAALDVRLPFGFLTSAGVTAALQAGELLRVRVAFTDGTSAPRVFEQCFAFHLEAIGPGTAGDAWVSRRETCPGASRQDTVAR